MLLIYVWKSIRIDESDTHWTHDSQEVSKVQRIRNKGQGTSHLSGIFLHTHILKEIRPMLRIATFESRFMGETYSLYITYF